MTVTDLPSFASKTVWVGDPARPVAAVKIRSLDADTRAAADRATGGDERENIILGYSMLRPQFDRAFVAQTTQEDRGRLLEQIALLTMQAEQAGYP